MIRDSVDTKAILSESSAGVLDARRDRFRGSVCARASVFGLLNSDDGPAAAMLAIEVAQTASGERGGEQRRQLAYQLWSNLAEVEHAFASRQVPTA